MEYICKWIHEKKRSKQISKELPEKKMSLPNIHLNQGKYPESN